MAKEDSLAALNLYRTLLRDQLLMLKIKDKLQEKPNSSPSCEAALDEIGAKLSSQLEDPMGCGDIHKKNFGKKSGTKLKASTKLYSTILSLIGLSISIIIVAHTGMKSSWSCEAPEFEATATYGSTKNKPKMRDPLRSKDFRETRPLSPTAHRVSQSQCSAPRDYSDKDGPCSSSPCIHPDAICKVDKVDPSLYECLCPSPFTGLQCETNMNDCQSDPCQNGGTCVDGVSAYICQCPVSYRGIHCKTLRGPCDDGNPCLQNAPCTNIDILTYNCDCPPGYLGQICQVDFDECESSPCANGGVCIDGSNGFTCDCGGGFSMDYCQIDFDECASNPCSANAYCENGRGEYKCHCRPGYTGEFCETIVSTCDSSPCYNGGTCVDKADAYECQCTSGYGFTHCNHNLNECEADEGHHLCEGGSCEDQGDGHHCYCGHGYTENADSTACIEATKCHDNPCKNNATCSGNGYTFNCTCVNENFSGPVCDWDTDACFASFPCGPGGNCVDTPNGFTCTCIEGYTGEKCDVIIPSCDSSPCQNGGTCINVVRGYKCKCDPEYDPRNCEVIDYCASKPCYNGGTCTSSGATFSCQCTTNWTGQTCLQNTEP